MSLSDIAALRKDYSAAELDESLIDKNPFKQFDIWFDQALKSAIYEANAMTLATADAHGKPSARIVLLKGFDERGFVFYTNYDSHKGQQLASNPQAALLFFWDVLERQIRIEGKIVKVSEEEAKAYFDSRPEGSRIGAIASPQSQVITNRGVLEERVKATKEAGRLEKPEHWGGYRVVPNKIEFWQGRSNRLHDRIVYELEESAWKIYRLAP
jgi:pyridoxamine 5'-phosphate oxidase